MDPRKDGDDLLSAIDKALEVNEIGSFQPEQVGVGMPEPIPPATPEHLVCLRGPCRYLYEATQFFGAGNPVGTVGVKNRITTRFCTVVVGGEPIDLTDEAVMSCNRWDPYVDQGRVDRCQAYLEANPQYKESKDA